MNPLKGISSDEARQLGRILDDGGHNLAVNLAIIDSCLPKEHQVFDENTTRPEVLLSAKNERYLMSTWNGDFLQTAFRGAWRLMGELHQVVERIPVLIVSSRHANASMFPNERDEYAIILESELLNVLHFVVSTFMALDPRKEVFPKTTYSEEEFARTLVYLAAYRATGESRYLRSAETLDLTFHDEMFRLTSGCACMILMFMLLHEYGHLLIAETNAVSRQVFATPKQSNEEIEYTADKFAVQFLNASAEFDLEFVKLFFRFEMLADAFATHKGIQHVGSHPDPHLRLKKIESEFGFPQSRLSREIDFIFERVTAYANLNTSSSLQPRTARLTTRNCDLCERPVATFSEADSFEGKILVITGDLANDKGIVCPNCSTFVCLYYCSITDGYEKCCPSCQQRLVSIIPVPDPVDSLYSRDPIEQSKAAAATIYSYIKNQEFVAARLAYDVLWRFGCDSSESLVANELAKVAVTLILETGKKTDWTDAEILHNHVAQLADAFREDAEIAIRFSESCLNYASRAIELERIEHVPELFKALLGHSYDWPDNEKISEHLLILLGYCCVIAGNNLDFDRWENLMGHSLRFAGKTVCNDRTRHAMSLASCYFLHSLAAQGHLEKGLSILPDLTTLALNWGDSQYREDYTNAVMGLNASMSETIGTEDRKLLTQLRLVALRHPEPKVMREFLGISMQVGFNACLTNEIEIARECYCDFQKVEHTMEIEHLVDWRGILGYQLIECLRRAGEADESNRLERELEFWISDSDRAASLKKMVNDLRN